jgi:hypothetical protein
MSVAEAVVVDATALLAVAREDVSAETAGAMCLSLKVSTLHYTIQSYALAIRGAARRVESHGAAVTVAAAHDPTEIVDVAHHVAGDGRRVSWCFPYAAYRTDPLATTVTIIHLRRLQRMTNRARYHRGALTARNREKGSATGDTR